MVNKSFKHQIIDDYHKIIEIKTVSAAEKIKNPFKGYHYHNCCQIIILQRGSAQFMVDNIFNSVNENSIVMLGSNLPHGIVCVSDDAIATIIHVQYKVLSCLIGFTEIEDEMQFIKESKYGYIFSSHNLNSKAYSICLKLKKSRGFKRMSYLFELLNILYKDPSKKQIIEFREDITPLNLNHTSVERAYSYIHRNFEQEITLNKVAEYANQNPTSLCRAFKKRTGFTIFQFINRLRIEKACQLLNTTELSITQVAFKVGYNTFSNFSTQFMRNIKLSPTEYRNI